MKKVLSVLAAMAVFISGCYADNLFIKGKSAEYQMAYGGIEVPFGWQKVNGIESEGQGYGLNIGYRGADAEGVSIMLEASGLLYIDDFYEDRQGENEYPFFGFNCLIGAGYDLFSLGENHVILSLAGGFEYLYHQDTYSYSTYDLKETNNHFYLIGGFDLFASKKISSSFSIFAQVTALGGIGFQSIEVEKDYGSHSDSSTKETHSALKLEVVPKIGLCYHL